MEKDMTQQEALDLLMSTEGRLAVTDLVKALREEAALLFSPGFSLIQTKNLMIEAADEIERLERCCNERDEFLGERGLFGEFIDWLRKSEPRRLIGG